jgi:hypothetical protein
MSIKTGSATFTRFFVPDAATEDFWSYVDEKLQAGVFKGIEDGEEQAVGFAAWEDFFDSTVPYGSCHKGEYVAFNFRTDQRKVPSIVIKQHIRDALQKYRSEHEGKNPSKGERREIQENIEKALRSRAFTQPSACEVVWSPSTKYMILGATSTKTIDSFLEHFEKHFGLYPAPLYHASWALNLIPLDESQKAALNSIVSLQFPEAVEQGRTLGYEFLTWLWFFTESGDGIIHFGEKRQAEVHLGERIVLTLPGDDKERIICTTQGTALIEARSALQQGKRVQEIQLFLRVAEDEYLLTLDSSLWAMKGIRMPKQLTENDEVDAAEGQFLERMYFIEEVSAILNALYGKFLQERLGPAWETEGLAALNRWIAGNDIQVEPAP